MERDFRHWKVGYDETEYEIFLENGVLKSYIFTFIMVVYVFFFTFTLNVHVTYQFSTGRQNHTNWTEKKKKNGTTEYP